MSLEHSPTRQGGRPHLTRSELADRWNLTSVSITRNYQRLGLKPIRLCGRLLFPLGQVEAVERRQMLQASRKNRPVALAEGATGGYVFDGALLAPRDLASFAFLNKRAGLRNLGTEFDRLTRFRRPKIAKLVALLASDGTRSVGAVRALCRTLASAGADWHDLAGLISRAEPAGTLEPVCGGTSIRRRTRVAGSRCGSAVACRLGSRISAASILAQVRYRPWSTLSAKQITVLDRCISKISGRRGNGHHRPPQRRQAHGDGWTARCPAARRQEQQPQRRASRRQMASEMPCRAATGRQSWPRSGSRPATCSMMTRVYISPRQRCNTATVPRTDAGAVRGRKAIARGIPAGLRAFRQQVQRPAGRANPLSGC